jgi:hypothetical protein
MGSVKAVMGRRGKSALGCLALIVLVSCVAPALASASSPEWYIGGHKFTEPKEIGWKGTIKFTTTELGITVSLKCEDQATGIINPLSSTGEVRTWKATNCINESHCVNPSMTFQGLPLATQLVTVGSTIKEYLGKTTEFPKVNITCSEVFNGEESCQLPKPTFNMLSTPNQPAEAVLSSERTTCFGLGPEKVSWEGSRKLEGIGGKGPSGSIEVK